MKKNSLLFLILTLFSVFVYADDIEIYLGDPDANSVNPNVLFIFDTSGSMKTNVTYCTEYGTKTTSQCVEWGGRRGNTCVRYEDVVEEGVCLRNATKTRLAITQEAAKKTINKLSGINLSLMQFNDKSSSGHDGGYVDLPMKSIDNATHRTNVLNKINTYAATTWTPIVESVHEAYLYMTGEDVKYAKGTRSVCTGSGKKKTCTDVTDYYSHSETLSGNKYISPITDTCQKNHVVLFTDGGSTHDGASDSDIRSLMRARFSSADLAGTGLGFSCTSNNTKDENNTTWTGTSCLRDIAYVMNNSDVSPLDGKQIITFHTIGGFIGGALQETLDAAAEFGGGISANAQNPEELEAALTKVFDNIIQSGGTFAAPAVAVNAFNSLEHLDQMYYSVFKPHESVGWSGNVKRYRMQGTKIVDADGNEAVDPETGFFKESAKSFWSQNADGDNIVAGGMANKLDTPRIVVSNVVSNNLIESGNRINASNTNLTRELLGTSLRDASFEGSDVNPGIDTGYTDSFTAPEFTKLKNWMGGYKAQETAVDSRFSMEDPLHSSPVLLNYGELNIEGKKVPDSTLFIGTNAGYLHAFDTNENNPKERFAFIPRELLPVATKYYEGAGAKKYGLDGHISVWHEDTNKNMIIDNGEKAYLYVGMRRGGSSYYALDVSSRDNPKLLWQINGKGHQSGPTPGFEQLGQTWSKMVPIDIKWKGEKKKALVFAGGYDIGEDTNYTRTDHSVGNAIFIVDAKTGELLWRASKSTGNLRLANMKSAITGNVVPIDDSRDGYVDMFYVADLGGRIWRFDINDEIAKDANGNPNQYMTGGMIADLGKDNSHSEHVRFYDTLDVVYTREFAYVNIVDGVVEKTKKPRYTLNIGSGYRAHPLDTSARDHFYVLFDYNITGEASYSSVTKNDLQEYSFASSSQISNMSPTEKSNNGFYIRLIDASTGEKVLSNSVTLDNTIYFTTFRPTVDYSSNSCSADIGSSRLYRISLDYEAPGAKVEDILVPGIPPAPIVKQTRIDDCSGGACADGNLKTTLVIGTKVVDDLDNTSFALKKTYWREMER